MRRLPLSVAVLIALGVGAVLSWWLVGSRTLHGEGSVGAEARTGPRVAPQRVVLFAPNLTEAAFALGHGDRVVGVTDYCVWPPELENRPRVGGMVDPNLERLVALDPDLLVLQGENPTLRRFATERGIRVADVKMDDEIESILRGFVTLDSLLSGGSTAAGHRLAERTRDVLDSLGALAATGPAPTVLLVLGREPGTLESVFTAGAGTFLADLVRMGGGEPWQARESRGYRNVSLESLVADPPDLAVEVVASDRRGIDADPEAPWRRLGLSRVRVEVLAFDGAMIPGPRMVETARRLRELIHPGWQNSAPRPEGR